MRVEWCDYKTLADIVEDIVISPARYLGGFLKIKNVISLQSKIICYAVRVR